jgi:hypothetical protein
MRIGAPVGPPQRPGTLALDHVFVAASRDAPEMELVRDAGFIEGPAHEHPGQGTASKGVFFENAYLELIWLTDPTVAAAPPVARTGLAHRTDPGHASCPLGFGLRSEHDPMPAPPFEVWEYAPPYLPQGSAFQMAANSEVLSEPLIFVLPWSRTPSWEVPDHPNGARRMTSVHFGPCPEGRSTVLSTFLDLGLVSCTPATAPLLRIELDVGRQGVECDLRPALPLIVRW